MTGFTPMCSLMEETKSLAILAVSFGNCSPNTFVYLCLEKDWKGMFYLLNWKYEVLLLLLLHWLKIRTETETETVSRRVETSGLSANQTCSWKAAIFFFSGVSLLKGREPTWVHFYSICQLKICLENFGTFLLIEKAYVFLASCWLFWKYLILSNSTFCKPHFSYSSACLEALE